ncbi:uncharacterized protein [Phaseolus vulgaris]|uniref:uncharacterized protein n=1 Tax=Phaseolus vulgaris TaxID=3885 RepID=UPI0035C9B731
MTEVVSPPSGVDGQRVVHVSGHGERREIAWVSVGERERTSPSAGVAMVEPMEASIDLQGTEVRLAGQEEQSIREPELGLLQREGQSDVLLVLERKGIGISSRPSLGVVNNMSITSRDKAVRVKEVVSFLEVKELNRSVILASRKVTGVEEVKSDVAVLPRVDHNLVDVRVDKAVFLSSNLMKEVWDEISGFRLTQLSKAWCVIGDFNSIRRQEERKSLISESDYSREIKGFNEFIEKSELEDIPSISDHCAVVLKEVSVDWGPRPFRCLDVWHKDSTFKDFVRTKWASYDVQGRGIFIFKEKLKKLKADLKVWNKEVFGDVNLASEELQKRINVLDIKDDDRGLDESEREERRSLLANLNKVMFKQEAIMSQKARQKWLKQGDLNTKFFHLSVKWRRARNELHGMFVNGRWCEDKEVIKDKVRVYFEDRFARKEGCQVRLDNVRFNSISEEDNELLIADFSEDEIRGAVWNCDSSKSPGPDGFNFGFLKHYWEIIKLDVLSAVKDFASKSNWPRGSNASFLCLVPKVENPQQLGEFRPISLVGCLYKIISKALSLRLKKVISKVIDFRQSAFLEGRGLLDSVLVANEVLLGFCVQWICWIKGCLESALVSVLVNSSPTREFIPRKGLRQGDPLAPFLFLIVAEGLTGVSRMAEEKSLIDSLVVGKANVKVNMLQYADDTLFFCEANTKSVFRLPVGGSHKRGAFWSGVLERVQGKLSRWREKLVRLQRNFLWGWGSDGKWIWRLGTDKGGLWKEILVSKYGGWRNLREVGKIRKGSLWWKDLMEVWASEGWGRSFEDGFQWDVGDGKGISFWEDSWLSCGALKVVFPRLFSLSLAKDTKVVELGNWIDGVWVWHFVWRRSFFEWEKPLEEQLVQLLQGAKLELGKEDCWIWKAGGFKTFTVNSTYVQVRKDTVGEVPPVYSKLWRCKALPSALFTAWRVIENKVATRFRLSQASDSVNDVWGAIWVGVENAARETKDAWCISIQLEGCLEMCEFLWHV